MSFRVVEQEEEVRANLQTESEEERIYQRVDHLDRSTEHIFRGQLEGATDCEKKLR
jgi:predicted RNA methylase